MALPRPIAPSQTDAKSPIDDNLMDSIRIDLDYLDSIASGGSALFDWNVSGELRLSEFLAGEALDTAVYYTEFTPATCRAVLKKSGIGGKIKFDLRKAITPKTPIIGIESLYTGSTQSIARIAPAVATQSIQRTTAVINTQSITFVKPSLNIQSITNLGNNLFKYNFSGALLDEDFKIGAYFIADGCTNAANDGTFEILEVNNSNFPSLIIQNPSGVEQIDPDGTVDLKLFSYNFTNPVDSDFVVGEQCLFASHSLAANNGLKEIYKTNFLGNNILVYNQTGDEQAGVAGNANVERWIFALSAPAVADQYAVGENALMASHSSANNNGQKRIVELNRAGNNLIIYNPNGVTQGGAAGNISSNRWVYSYSTDPSADVLVGAEVSFESHSNANNNKILEIVIVNFAAANNLVVYNETAVAQAGIAGQARHTLKKVKFLEDLSAIYEAGESLIEMQDTVSTDYEKNFDKPLFEVVDVNYGGGANYNVVIDGRNFPEQVTPAGFVHQEMRSIFLAPPEQTISTIGNTDDRTIRLQSTNFKAGSILPSDTLYLYLLEVPEGQPKDLTVWLQ